MFVELCNVAIVTGDVRHRAEERSVDPGVGHDTAEEVSLCQLGQLSVGILWWCYWTALTYHTSGASLWGQVAYPCSTAPKGQLQSS